MAVGSCSAQHHNGWLRPSSSRGTACPAESKNKFILLSQSSGPLSQSQLSVLRPRGGDLANGNHSAFCLRSSHNHREVVQKIQNRPFEGHSGLSFKRDFLTCVCVPWARAKELRANSRDAEKLLPHQVLILTAYLFLSHLPSSSLSVTERRTGSSGSLWNSHF